MPLCHALCPFARMMNQYNFSGEWIMTHPDNGDKYMLHVCHPTGNEIYFGFSKFEEPDWLIGFGGGNWVSTSVLYIPCNLILPDTSHHLIITMLICIYVFMYCI